MTAVGERGDTRGMIAIDEREELLDGLRGEQPILPPRLFYDEVGSLLFEEICELPEYYQTRTEAAILEAIASDLIERRRPASIVELGAGSATKTRILLRAAAAKGLHLEYLPVDISGEMLSATAERLRGEFPGLVVSPIEGTFDDGLAASSASPRLLLFLGGTIGNFAPHEAVAFLRALAARLGADDRFLLGVDLIKDPRLLHAAYNDAAAVTAAFNLNILRVVNRRLGTDFDPADFAHYAFYNPAEEQIEMHLAALRDVTVTIDGADDQLHFERGTTIRTEISRKYSRRSLERLLKRAGLRICEFHTDTDDRFALAVIAAAEVEA